MPITQMAAFWIDPLPQMTETIENPTREQQLAIINRKRAEKGLPPITPKASA